MKEAIESVEKNISSMLYKLAVEQGIINNIVACYNGVNDETVGEKVIRLLAEGCKEYSTIEQTYSIRLTTVLRKNKIQWSENKGRGLWRGIV